MHIVSKNISTFPHEILINILAFLTPPELGTVAKVSKFIKELSEDPSLWKAFSVQENLFYSLEGIQNWKEFYLNNSLRTLNYRVQQIKKPIIEVSNRIVHLSQYPWLIYSDINEEGERQSIIRYKQKYAHCFGQTSDDLRFGGGNNLVICYSASSQIVIGKFDVNAESDEVQFSQVPIDNPCGLYFENPRWVFVLQDTQLSLNNTLLNKSCVFDDFHTGQFLNSDQVQAFGEYIALYKAETSELSFCGFTQSDKKSMEAILTLQVKSAKCSFHYPNFAYVAETDSSNEITVIDINTKDSKQVSFPSRGGLDSIMGVTRFEIFEEKLLVILGTNKFLIKDIHRNEELFGRETFTLFSWKIFPQHQKILEKDHNVSSGKGLYTLRDLTAFKKTASFTEEIDTLQVHENHLFITSSHSKTMTIWNLVNLERINKIDIESFDFPSHNISFCQNAIFISGMNKSITLSYQLQLQQSQKRKSVPIQSVEKKAKRRLDFSNA